MTEPGGSAAEDEGVHVYSMACHRMCVLAGASLCRSRPSLSQNLRGQASQAFLFPFLGCDSGLRGGMSHRHLSLAPLAADPVQKQNAGPLGGRSPDLSSDTWGRLRDQGPPGKGKFNSCSWLWTLAPLIGRPWVSLTQLSCPPLEHESCQQA